MPVCSAAATGCSLPLIRRTIPTDTDGNNKITPRVCFHSTEEDGETHLPFVTLSLFLYFLLWNVLWSAAHFKLTSEITIDSIISETMFLSDPS